MGYDVHITRADDWAENEGCPITVAEWLAVIDKDESLRLAGHNGPNFAIWNRHPTDREAWLVWNSGNITTKNPDGVLLGKMLEIAGLLGAKVQGDDGEVYPIAASDAEHLGKVSWIWSNASVIAFILSLVALGCILVAVPLDTSVRQEHPVGTPMPLKWALVLAAVTLPGLLSWFIGTALAVLSIFLFRPRSGRYTIWALVVNLGTAALFLYRTK